MALYEIDERLWLEKDSREGKALSSHATNKGSIQGTLHSSPSNTMNNS